MEGEWQQISLKSTCVKIGSGATPRGGKEAYRGGNTTLIRSQNIYNNGFIHEGLVSINASQAYALRNVVVEDGDVLLNITGDSVGRCCQVDPQILPARVNQHVAIIRPRSNLLDARFLRYVLVSPLMQVHLLALASAGATRNALTKGMIESLIIKVPAIEQQRAIAHILGTLDDKIELNRKMNKTLEAMAQALFKSWFVDFDGVAKEDLVESEIGLIPKRWRAMSLAEAFEINPKRELKKETIAPYLDMASVPTAGAVPDAYVMREFSSGTKFINGDTLLARITPCLENGKTAFVNFLEAGQVGWGSTEFIGLRPKPPMPPFFGYLLARREDFRMFAIQAMSGTSGRQRVEVGQLQNFKIAFPNEATANAFAAFVEPLKKALFENAAQATTLAQLRDTLLPKLISGQLRVGDAEKFLAGEVLLHSNDGAC